MSVFGLCLVHMQILNAACETMHVLLDKTCDAQRLELLSTALFDLLATDTLTEDHIALRSVLPSGRNDRKTGRAAV